ncbi:hypothetical protein H5410_001919 [Solanum commersonii]|uniref:Uncharacterized protein n=1 Tax=Solanum commersonii TaxID=4109 RepID=A0A9J6B0X0_SOLCO|nr:hypothetical protein H5410_001919 [Solanum commersonii]
MKGGEESGMSSNGKSEVKKMTKPPFRPAKDDTKPLLQDPILRSDPIETEEFSVAVASFSNF